MCLAFQEIQMTCLRFLPVEDSQEHGARCYELLRLNAKGPRAVELGRETIEAINRGFYLAKDGRSVNWRAAVESARHQTISIPGDAELPVAPKFHSKETIIRIANIPTLSAAYELCAEDCRTLTLNFANPNHPCGAFLRGGISQEETICRSTALYATLMGDPMYDVHNGRLLQSSDWAILSAGVPVYRASDGTPLQEPWLVNILTSAAPYAPAVGQPEAANQLRQRILRILAISKHFGYTSLVLGAFGCGAFRNDVAQTARDFRIALEVDFSNCFRQVVFAIADWSPERRFLGPFAHEFARASS
jgi:uncharacterized protein (TIGR02452 family)